MFYWTSNEQFKSKIDLALEKLSKITSASLTKFILDILKNEACVTKRQNLEKNFEKNIEKNKIDIAKKCNSWDSNLQPPA